MWIGFRSQSHLRLGFDSDSRLSTFHFRLFPPSSDRGRAGSGESLSSIIVLLWVYSIPIICVAVVVVYVCQKWKTRKHLTARGTQLKEKSKKTYDGLKAVTHHAEAKKHKECESAAAMSPRMKSFFTPKGSAQSEKVDIAEFTEFYHSIKRHISYVAQDCSLKVLKQVINDSDIVKQMTGGLTKCTALAILSDQENEILGEANPIYNGLYLYFTYNFMASFQEIILLVEKHTTAAFNLHNIMVKFHDTISKKINYKYFGIKVHVALKKCHLPDHEVEKFTKNATNAYHRALAYIEKWYSIENQNYKTFSCLNLECGRLPTLDQLLELWSISPWKQQTPPEPIYDELAALQSVFPSLKLEGNSIEMWCKFFQKEEAPNLLKIVQFVCSVPVSIAFVERIFSAMGNVWTNKRNRFAVNTVKSELCIFFNINSSCTEFKDVISTNKPLLKAVSSNAKYTKK
ncbi:uncharacterized protein TNCV_4867131 [Trichonephila clavipes]|nr:uncharacterized protein TNCV_4867131 [Trichonephila clavipes]